MAARAQVEHAGGADVGDGLVGLLARHLAEPLDDLGDARELAADRVESLQLDRALGLAGDALDVALEQLGLIQDHGERIVDLVGDADRHLAERRELVLAQDLAQVLGEADGAVGLAALVAHDRARDRDRDLLAALREEARLQRLHAAAARAHGLHHALGFVEARIQLGDEAAEDLGVGVAEALLGAVVVVDDGALAIGRDDDVGRPLDELQQTFLRESQARLRNDYSAPCSASQRSASIAAMQPVPAAVTA